MEASKNMRRATALFFLMVAFTSAQVVEPDPTSLLAGKSILVLDGPSGSHSSARNAATEQLNAIQQKIGFELTIGDHGAVSTGYLANFDMIVFNYYFQTEQASTGFKNAIQAWYESGGKGYVGYHTSGANQSGEWDWYRDNVTSMRYELHSTGAQEGTIFRTEDADVLESPIMRDLPESFTGVDEWYDFEFGLTFDDAEVMYNLDETTLANPLQRPMDPHPMAWYREDAAGSRYFYTAIIHTPTGVQSDFFQSLIMRAMEWVAGYEEGVPGCPWENYQEYKEDRTVDDTTLCLTVGIDDQANVKGDYVRFFQSKNAVSINVAHRGDYGAVFSHVSGKQVSSEKFYNRRELTIDTEGLETGMYVLQVLRNGRSTAQRVFFVE